MNRLERNRRPLIDPTKIRKHSHIVADKQDPFLVLGDRTQTDYGFTVSGVQNKAFETLHMVIVPSSMTPTWLHAKKARVYRVVSGSGYYQQFGDGAFTRPLSAGDEVLVEAGKVHRLSSGVLRLEVYVTQEGKYQANLEEVAPVESVAQVNPADLQSISLAEKRLSIGDPIPRRRSRKAAEQIAAMRGDRSHIDRSAQEAERGDNFLRNNASPGVNARPIMDFSEEGAG